MTVRPFNADSVEIARREKGITLMDLSQRVGIHYRTLQEMLRRGTGKDIPIKKLALELDIPLNEIYCNPKPKTNTINADKQLILTLVEELAKICTEPDIEMSPKTILRISSVLRKIGFDAQARSCMLNAAEKQLLELDGTTPTIPPLGAIK